MFKFGNFLLGHIKTCHVGHRTKNFVFCLCGPPYKAFLTISKFCLAINNFPSCKQFLIIRSVFAIESFKNENSLNISASRTWSFDLRTLSFVKVVGFCDPHLYKFWVASFCRLKVIGEKPVFVPVVGPKTRCAGNSANPAKLISDNVRKIKKNFFVFNHSFEARIFDREHKKFVLGIIVQKHLRRDNCFIALWLFHL